MTDAKPDVVEAWKPNVGDYDHNLNAPERFSSDDRVMVLRRDGRGDGPWLAAKIEWHHQGVPSDIMFYQVALSTPKVQTQPVAIGRDHPKVTIAATAYRESVREKPAGTIYDRMASVLYALQSEPDELSNPKFIEALCRHYDPQFDGEDLPYQSEAHVRMVEAYRLARLEGESVA